MGSTAENEVKVGSAGDELTFRAGKEVKVGVLSDGFSLIGGLGLGTKALGLSSL